MKPRYSDLPLSRIRLDGDTQPRFRLDDNIVSQFTHDMRAGSRFPPVHVFEDAKGNIWMADGFHRYKATENLGHSSISAVIEEGTKEQAFEYAVREAGSHFPLKLAEKKAAAKRFLKQEPWSSYTSNRLGRLCGLDHKTIESLRGERYWENTNMEASNRSRTPSNTNGGNGASGVSCPGTTVSLVTDPQRDAKTEKRGRGPGRKFIAATIIEHDGQTHSLVEWSRMLGVPYNTIRLRLRHGEPPAMALRPVANVTRTFVRNGKEYRRRVTGKVKRSRLSPKAQAILKKHPVLQDSKQRSELASMSVLMQVMIAKRLSGNSSATVQDAKKEILAGAPVDSWAKAYSAVVALNQEDQVRLVQQVWRGWTREGREVLIKEHESLV